MANDDKRPALPADGIPMPIANPWTATVHIESWQTAVEWSHQQLADRGAVPVPAAEEVDLFASLCATCGGIGQYKGRPCPECGA